MPSVTKQKLREKGYIQVIPRTNGAIRKKCFVEGGLTHVVLGVAMGYEFCRYEQWRLPSYPEGVVDEFVAMYQEGLTQTEIEDGGKALMININCDSNWAILLDVVEAIKKES